MASRGECGGGWANPEATQVEHGAATTGRLTEAAVVDQAMAIPMMVLAVGTNTTTDMVAVTVRVVAVVAVVTTK